MTNQQQMQHWLGVGAPFVLIAGSAALAAWSGQRVGQSPDLVILLAILCGGLLLTTLGRLTEPLFLASAGLIVLGYAVQGRGFAYLGVAPLYVGEVVLALGVSSLILSKNKPRMDRTIALISTFMVLGMMRTIPYITDYQIMAFRDAAAWYYCVFALLIVTTLTPKSMAFILKFFAKCIPIILVWYLAMSTVINWLEDQIPHLPGSPVPMISVMKAGERGVVLAAIAVFVMAGLYEKLLPRRRLPILVFWLFWLTNAALTAAENRGALVSMVFALGVAWLLRPSLSWIKLAYVGAAMLVVLVVAKPNIDVGGGRSLSVEQMSANIESLYSDDSPNVGSVQGNRDWRLKWWSSIYDDTVAGPLFWTGWGFGHNLAAEYQVTHDLSSGLRSPHSIHMTVLARMGVPGLMLWIAILVSYSMGMLRAIGVARKMNWEFRHMTLVFLFGAWLASLVSASFDVYLEGPSGAIPFWSLLGAGVFVINLAIGGKSRNGDEVDWYALACPSSVK